MTHKRLTYLLEQYKAGTCTEKEKEELDELYNILDQEEYSHLPNYIIKNREQYTAERFKRLKQLMDKQQQVRKIKWYQIAAAVIVLIGIGAVLYPLNNFFSHVNNPEVVSYSVGAGSKINSRFLQLPDSSVVILRSGSKLQVDTNSFGIAGRHVTLKGEAYFDIYHDAAKPFTIKAGDVNVTVLGTAFNIRESGDSVAVSVTRGKVKVSKGSQTIALLTAAQQLVYVKQHVTQQTVQPDKVTTWVKEGLQFNGATFASIASMLEERYGVHISFESEKMKACKVSAATAFNGTETIDEVLSFICTIANATYTKDGITVKIHGEGCGD